MLTENDWKGFAKIASVLVEGFEEDYMHWMQKLEQDPQAAGMEFMDALRSKMAEKNSPQLYKAAEILKGILEGDTSYWHRGSADLKEALQFFISNNLMKGMKLGVLKTTKESKKKDGETIIENKKISEYNPSDIAKFMN